MHIKIVKNAPGAAHKFSVSLDGGEPAHAPTVQEALAALLNATLGHVVEYVDESHPVMPPHEAAVH